MITITQNKTVPITKEQFIKAINDIKEYHEKINKIQIDEFGNNIGYFVYELKFGTQWAPVIVTDENGNDIKLETAENLYDYLVSNL